VTSSWFYYLPKVVHIYIEISSADDVDEQFLFCASQLKLTNIASGRNISLSVVKAVGVYG
jgi:hypothetical protein